MSSRLTVENRKYYRLQYPMAEQPTVRTKEWEYLVTEISEKGARVLAGGKSALEGGALFGGEIRFKDNGTTSIEGIVLRRDEKYIAVQLFKGISPQRMLTEQVRLREKYPMRFDVADNDGKLA